MREREVIESVGVGLRYMALVVVLAVASSCGGSNSGSSVQPVCDGSGDAGGVGVIVAPSPCDALVDVPTNCPMALMCQITVSNNNAEDIDVSMVSGSASVPTLDFTVLQGENRTVDVFYVCGANIDESGRMQIDVSLAGGQGAFCGRDLDWSVDVTVVP
jgi:hypothetical protein